MAPPQTAIRIGRDEGDGFHARWRDDLAHDGNRRRGKPPQRALFPRGDHCADCIVVVDGRAGARERQSPAVAFTTPAHRPSRRCTAALAERRHNPWQPRDACLAELDAPHSADHTLLRQQEVEHDPKVRDESSRLCQGMETAVKRRAAAIGLVALAVTGCGSSSRPLKAIVYTKFLGGGGQEVWIAAPDGSRKLRLADGGSPRLSPDGRWVAFQGSCDRGYCDKLLLIPSGGGKLRTLADNVLESTWSRDGRRLLAYRTVSEEVGRLLVVDRDGGGTVAVARGNLVGWTFSPNGKEVAYGRDVKGRDDVFVVPAQGGTPRRITHDGRSASPVWTTKGILISRGVSGRRIPHHGWGANEIWLVDSGGVNPTSLSGPLPAHILGSGITGLIPVAWLHGALLAGLINEFGSPPYAFDPRAKTVRPIGKLGFGGVADGLSRDGRSVLVEAGNTETVRNRRVVVLPFAGGKGRLIARFAGDASWNL